MSAAQPPAAAEEILRGAPQTTQEVLGWSIQTLAEAAATLLRDNLQAPAQFALKTVVYLMAAGALNLMVTGRWRRCTDGVAVLGFGAMSLHAMAELVSATAQTAADCHAYLITFVPVYSGVAALAGQTAGAALYSGMFLGVSAFLASGIEKVLLPVLQIYFCLSVCAALWGDAGVEQAAALFARGLSLLLKGCGLVFSFVLGLQNVLAANLDSAALKCGQSVLQGAIPVVGDAASAALGSALAAVRLLKGSLALAALLALGAAFAPVLLRCGLYFAALSAAGIAAQACGAAQCGQLCRLYAKGTRLCAAVLVLYFFMVFLSTALLLILGNGG